MPTAGFLLRKTDEKVAQNVTESLMELRQMMHTQVKQSEETMHVLGGFKKLHHSINPSGCGSHWLAHFLSLLCGMLHVVQVNPIQLLLSWFLLPILHFLEST